MCACWKICCSGLWPAIVNSAVRLNQFQSISLYAKRRRRGSKLWVNYSIVVCELFVSSQVVASISQCSADVIGLQFQLSRSTSVGEDWLETPVITPKSYVGFIWLNCTSPLNTWRRIVWDNLVRMFFCNYLLCNSGQPQQSASFCSVWCRRSQGTIGGSQWRHVYHVHNVSGCIRAYSELIVPVFCSFQIIKNLPAERTTYQRASRLPLRLVCWRSPHTSP